jgi:2-keto-4-pentenoate hydratase
VVITSTRAELDGLAARLRNAERNRTPVEPLTDTAPGLTVRDAYAIQQLNIDARRANGERLIGHKIGLTARAMQEKFGVSEPDFGHLLDTMMLADDEPLDLTTLIDPQVEVEPAFVLGRRLEGPNVTAMDVIAATEYVCACFEIIDSRIVNWRIKLADTVADNGSSARLLLGSARHDASRLALDDMHTVLEIDDRIVEEGNTGAILGHPANGIAWLANKLNEFGVALDAGHIVLPGTCTRSYRLDGVARVRGTIAGLGEVVLDCTGRPAIAGRNA